MELSSTSNPVEDMCATVSKFQSARIGDEESQKLFDHPRAAETFGASVFWIRPALLVLETLEEFIGHWQMTRDQTRRGIVEVRA
jgi:hypothetical protein